MDLLEGDEMDIARSLAQRRRDNQVHQVDDGRLIGHDLDVVEIFALAVRRRVRVEIFDHLLDRDLVALGNFLGNFRGGRFGFLDLQTGQQADVIDDLLFSGSSGEDADGGGVDADGNDAMAFGEFSGNGAHGFSRYLRLARASRQTASATTSFHVNCDMARAVTRNFVRVVHTVSEFGFGILANNSNKQLRSQLEQLNFTSTASTAE